MPALDLLRRVRKGDPLSASQQNLIIDFIRGGAGLHPESFTSGSKAYLRNKIFPSSIESELRVKYGETNGTTNVTLFDTSSDISSGEVALIRGAGITFSHPSYEFGNSLNLWFFSDTFTHFLSAPQTYEDEDLGGDNDTIFSSDHPLILSADTGDTQYIRCNLDNNSLGEWQYQIQYEILPSTFGKQSFGFLGTTPVNAVTLMPPPSIGEIHICPRHFLSMYATVDGYFNELQILHIEETPDEVIVNRFFEDAHDLDTIQQSVQPCYVDSDHEWQGYNNGATDKTTFMCAYFSDIIKSPFI